MKFRCVILLALVVIVTGCGTSFVGSKLPADGALPRPAGAAPGVKAKHGVPFMLPRPDFRLKITPDETDASKANYELAVTYVPDPEQTYSLRLDPTALIQASFKLEYSESMPGVLSGIGGGLNEQVTPTIKAIGSFTASLIGLGTAIKLDDQDISSQPGANVSSQLAVNGPPQPAANGSSPGTPPKPILAEIVETIIPMLCEKVAPDIADDLKHLVPVSLDPSVPDVVLWRAVEQSMRTLYHYKTPDQRACLTEVARHYMNAEKTIIKQEKKNLLCDLAGLTDCEKEDLKCPPEEKPGASSENARPAGETDSGKRDLECPSEDQSGASSENVCPAGEDEDSRMFRKAVKSELLPSNTLKLTGLLGQVDRGLERAVEDSEEEKMLQCRQATLREAIKIARRPVDGRTPTVKFLEFFALMPQDVWRARHVLFLRRMRGLCIAESFQGKSTTQGDPGEDKPSDCESVIPIEEEVNPGNIAAVIAQIDRKIALTAGEATRYERILKLSDFLSSVRDRDVQGGKAPAAAEYVVIRGEFDTLSSSYQDAVDALAARNKDGPSLPAPEHAAAGFQSSPEDPQHPSASRGKQSVSARDLHDVPIKPLAFIHESQVTGWTPDGHPDFVIVVEPDSTKGQPGPTGGPKP